MKVCPFCDLPTNRVVHATKHCVVVRDLYPVSRGHTLIVPKRHIGRFGEATEAERRDLLETLEWTRVQLVEDLAPDGFNIGINDGEAAGQTVAHLHVHLIPRFHGDCVDPRGGIRWIFPDKADYWTAK